MSTFANRFTHLASSFFRALNISAAGAGVVASALCLGPDALAGETPFLSVDMNGYNAGGGQTMGPTQAGFQGWEAAEGLFLDPSIDWGNSGAAGLTRAFATTQGSITANLRGIGIFRGARNRGANADVLGDMSQDFVFAQRDNQVNGFGQNFISLTLSGLAPGQTYQFTGYARDHFNGGTDSFQAWTDRAALGGLDGPGAWMDANVGPGAVYQPAPGGVNNPIPTLARSATSGPAAISPFDYAGNFVTTASAAGVIEVYTWADPNSFSGVQGASLLNGFEVTAVVPGPGSIAVVLGGALALGGRRRRA